MVRNFPDPEEQRQQTPKASTVFPVAQLSAAVSRYFVERKHMSDNNVFNNNKLPTPANDNLLTETEVAKRLGVTKRCLQTWRYRGGGPRFVKISDRCIRYRPDDVGEFVETRLRVSTSDPGAGGAS